MNKHLFIMRHAKSDWSQDVPDFDRPLNSRGRKAAKAMGRWLSEYNPQPEALYSSTACRAEQTVLRLTEPLGFAEEKINWEPDLYLASRTDLLEMIATWLPRHSSLLFVAHNPGLEDLLIHLVPEKRLRKYGQHFPTAALAHLEIPSGADLSAGVAELQCIFYPRALES